MKSVFSIIVLLLFGSSLFAQENVGESRGRDSVAVNRNDGAIPLPDVYVYGSRLNFGARSSQMSAVALPAVDVKRSPAIFGETDVMKVLQKLPGVQSAGDGRAGIFVRGGNYDQNLITLDGSTLYNAEHLRGFVSAINADMIDNVVLYKGGFPARYGARLSGIVDIGVREGNFEKFHGSAGIGMLSSRVNVEGPVIKGTTSFNVGVRVSYFDAVVMPLLEKIYDDTETLNVFSKMDYYDVSAKLVHKFSSRDKLSAVFYMGKDVNDSAPSDSKLDREDMSYSWLSERSNRTENEWGNILSSIYYTHRPNENLLVNTNLSFSRYDYRLKLYSKIHEQQYGNGANGNLIYEYDEDSNLEYNSDIDDLSLSADFDYRRGPHDIRWGGKLSFQRFGPVMNVFKESCKKQWTGSALGETRYFLDTVLGGDHNMYTLSLYAEDDFEVNNFINVNYGLRYSFYSVKSKSYHSLEPRLSLRFLLNEKMAIKASYSRMAQGLHLLSNSNLVMPSDIWVPVTDEIPLMTSNQWALGYSYDIAKGVGLSVEGYYKSMDNVLEYAEGASYTRTNGNWQNQVVLGEGRAYGVEFLLEKREGKTTGWIGYTWAKSLRQFDSKEGMLNGGREFYAGNDRRHNFNIVFSHQFNKHWRISANWTFQSGRRGTITTSGIYGGKPDEFDPYSAPFSSQSGLLGEYMSTAFDKPLHFIKFLRYYTPDERNGYVLPEVHRLDLGVNYSTFVGIGDMDISLDVYNVYNRMNISNVYLGYEDDKPVLKGVCMFPIMPSLSFALTF